MLKKYYILALTFLCLFLGQVSYGLGNGDYYGDEDDFTIHIYYTAEEYFAAHPEHSQSFNGETVMLSESQLNLYMQVHPDESALYIETINGEPFYLVGIPNGINFDNAFTTPDDTCYSCDCDPFFCTGGDPANDPTLDICDLFPSYCDGSDDTNDPCDPSSACGQTGGNPPQPPVLKNWYLDNDSDGYEAGTQTSEASPGLGWKEGASMGIDCNDNDPVIRECIEPKPVEVINPATCRCIDPPNKSKFNNVTNVWNVLDGKKWILYQTNCNTSARKQNAESLLPNTTPVGAGMQENTFVDKKRQTESGQITPNIDMQKAIDIVIKNLKENKPVMAGVMYERYYGADPNLGGTPDDNNNVATNHYVTIVGMGIDNGKPYFSYYDNFVDSQFKDGSPRSNSTLELIGTNTSENRFYYYQDSVGNYYFSDKTAKTLDGPTIDSNHNSHGFGNQYILTEIRDNY